MSDRAAIVTGASSGIGLAIAHVLGQEGYGITAAARRPDKLNAAAEELRGAGYEVEEVAGNMGDAADIHLLARGENALGLASLSVLPRRWCTSVDTKSPRPPPTMLRRSKNLT